MATKWSAQEKYKKANTRRYVFNLNKRTDADIIAFLEGVTNKQGLFKELLRKRIKEEGGAASKEDAANTNK